VGYQRRWTSGWAVQGDFGLGWAEDRLRGRRWVGQCELNLTQAWTQHVRSTVGYHFSASPSYRSWGGDAAIHYGF
jgi:hypothetical protein